MALEKISYLNLPNCFRLSNGEVEVVVTTDIGPRIIRYGFTGHQNMLGELPEAAPDADLDRWKPWGGHRLWAAPEAMPRTYAPDNTAIEYEILGENSIKLMQPTEPAAGIQKEITVTVEPGGTAVAVRHRITNRNLWPIELAPWAITIMNGGGEVILPQEPYRPHPEALLPARALVLWHYTDLSDPRWTLGREYIRLRCDAASPEPQKIGIANKQGWAAYLREETLFVKRFPYQEGAVYPDYGCNTETFTAGSFIELESLGPLTRLEPEASADHVERWHLFGNISGGEVGSVVRDGA
ncbi:MAG TPA: hypothetical protein VE262_23270 [Blastocatellia bacterium]|nr:hypothetical protein [Blastocatellia bacterium]